MIIEKHIPIPIPTPEIVIRVDKNIPIKKTNKAIEQDLVLHNLAATAKYHANHLHNSGCYDTIDKYHDDMAYDMTIKTIQFAKLIGLL